MDEAKLLRLALLVVFLVVQPRTSSQWLPRPAISPRPLCASQFALASHACAYLPYVPTPTPSPPTPPTEQLRDRHDDDDDDDDEEHDHQRGHGHQREREHGHQHEREHGHQREREHGNQHNRNRDHAHQHNRNRDHEHQHRHHRHRHGHRHVSTPIEENCCRWLGSIDSECVCDLLVHLPPFLSRPLHKYTVMVRDSCNVTFQCSSRISA